jgi:hypothetical protein
MVHLTESETFTALKRFLHLAKGSQSLTKDGWLVLIYSYSCASRESSPPRILTKAIASFPAVDHHYWTFPSPWGLYTRPQNGPPQFPTSRSP